MDVKKSDDTAFTYGDLFDYLEDRLMESQCDGTLRHTREFAIRHQLFYGELSQILADFAGHCDCEVLFNVASCSEIDPAEVIGAETFSTPRKLAIAHGLYCCCRIDGRPVPPEEAHRAGLEGREGVQVWAPCGANTEFAVPDLNRGYALLGSQEG